MIINDLDGYYIVFDTKNWNTELDTLLNNRNITPFTADIRKEEKLILLFTQSLGMPLYKGDSSYRVKSEEFWTIPLPHILCSEPTCH